MFGIDDIVAVGLKLIDKVIPDPQAKADALFKLKQLEQTGELAELNAEVQMSQGQIDTNKVEAGSSSLFVAGWRPSIGWVGSISLGLAYIPKEIVLCIMWGIGAYHAVQSGHEPPPYPDLGITDLLGLLGSMLGMGYYRHREKLNGVAS